MHFRCSLGLLSLSALARSSDPDEPFKCPYPDHASNLPLCTSQCLTNAVYENVCGDDLKGVCFFSDGVKNLFAEFGGCLEKSCNNDADRYNFVDRFKQECASASKRITSISGVFGNYLTRTSSTSTETPSTKTVEGILISSNPAPLPSTTFPASSTSSSSPSASPQSTAATPAQSPSSPSPSSSASPSLSPSTPSPTDALITRTYSSDTASHSSPAPSSNTRSSSRSSSPSATAAPVGNKSLSRTTIIASSAGGGIVGLALAISIIAFVLHRRRQKRQAHEKREFNDLPMLTKTNHHSSPDRNEGASLLPPVSSFQPIPELQNTSRSIPWEGSKQEYRTNTPAPPLGVPQSKVSFKPELDGESRYPRLQTHTSSQPPPSELGSPSTHPHAQSHLSRTPSGYSELSGIGSAPQIPISRTPTGFSELSVGETPVSPASTGVSERGGGMEVPSSLATVTELEGEHEQRNLWKRNTDLGRNFRVWGLDVGEDGRM